MAAFLVRRFLARDRRLAFNASVLLHPRVKAGGVRWDSAIVGGFILFHVGSRFLGQALRLARSGRDQPHPALRFAHLANPSPGSPPRPHLRHPPHLVAGDGLDPGLLPLFRLEQARPPDGGAAQPGAGQADRARPARSDPCPAPGPGAEPRLPPGAATLARPVLAAPAGRLRLHHVQPLPGRVPGARAGRCSALGPGDQQALRAQPELPALRDGAASPPCCTNSHQPRSGVGLHHVLRLCAHVPGGQRADGRHHRHPPAHGFQRRRRRLWRPIGAGIDGQERQLVRQGQPRARPVDEGARFRDQGCDE